MLRRHRSCYAIREGTAVSEINNGRDTVVLALAWTPALETVTWSTDRTIVRWSTDDHPTVLATLKGHAWAALAIVDRFAIVSSSQYLDVVSLDDGSVAGRLVHTRVETALTLPSGRVLTASTSAQGTIGIWTIPSGQGGLVASPIDVTSVTVVDDRIVIGDRNGSVQIWDAELRTRLASHAAHHAEITAIDAGHGCVISGAINGEIRLWNGSDSPVRLAKLSSRIVSLALLSARTAVAADLHDIFLLDLAGHVPPRRYELRTRAKWASALANEVAVFVDGEGKLMTWNAGEEAPRRASELDVTKAALSSHGQLAVVDPFGKVTRLDLS